MSLARLILRLKLHLRREEGDAIIETAMTLILYFLMLFGIVEFAMLMYSYHFVGQAAKQAARWAAVNGSTCGDDNSCNGTPPMDSRPATSSDIQTYVTNMAQALPGINSSGSRLSVSTCGTSGGTACADSVPAVCATTPDYPGCVVQVKVSYKYNYFVPLVHVGSLTLSSTAEMVIAH